MQQQALPQDVAAALNKVRGNPSAFDIIQQLLLSYERVHSQRYDAAKEALVLTNTEPVRNEALTQLGARNALRALLILIGDK